MGLKQFWKKLNLPWRRERYVGEDLAGNLYFQAPPIGLTYKDKRFVLFANGSQEYTPNSIDVLWSSWLRHTRQNPPSMHELQADVKRLQDLKVKVDAIAAKDEIAKQKEKMLGESPVGQGDLFKPGAWKP